MVDFEQAIMKEFKNSFNEDVACYFRNGYVDTDLGYEFAPAYVNMLSDSFVQKPEGDVFISTAITYGTTINGSIGLSIVKEDLFSLNFRIYTPSGKSFKKEKDLESVLDSIFLNKAFDFSDFSIYSDTDSPKDTSRDGPTKDGGYFIKSINYRMICRYI